MNNLLVCLVCGFECKGLTLHLRHKHQLTPSQYREQFPGAAIFSNAVRAQMSDSNALKGTRSSFEERFGERAKEIKAKIGKNSGNSRRGKKRPEQGETLKRVWEDKRDVWTASIAEAARTPERREKSRLGTKRRIDRDGYHLARGKETSFERFARETLENAGYEVIRQKGTKRETLGTVRFFDLFVPSLNLLIECDGEYWHSTPSRIEIDTAKNKAAELEGYKLLRISDREFPQKLRDPSRLLELLDLSDEELLFRSNQLIQDRRIKLNAQFCS